MLSIISKIKNKIRHTFLLEFKASNSACIHAKIQKIKKISHLLFILICVSSVYAQEDSNFIFEGQILNEDSLPIEDLYLINYRSLEFHITDEDGRFEASVMPGDSLMTYHINHEKIIIKTYISDSIPTYQLPYKFYDLLESNVSVVIKKRSVYEEILLNNFNRNWDRMLVQIQNEISYIPVREKAKTPKDSIKNNKPPSVINDVILSNRGGVNAGLDIDAICAKIRKIKKNRQLK